MSGRAPKLFPKCLHPLGSDRVSLPFSKAVGNTYGTFSMAFHRDVEVRGDGGGEDRIIPVAFISTYIIRRLHDLDLEKDISLMKMISQYLQGTDWRINVLSTSTLGIRDYLQPNFPRNPSRAAELRAIGISTVTPGWLAKIWPGLKTAVSIVSGVFSAAVPKMQHYVGPNVHIRAVGYIASEGSIGTVYNPQELNLFRSITGDVVECLDVSLDETAASLVPAWELQTGHKYEIVLTTRNGLWRYRMEDIVEIAGFDPRDGTPILQYVERRNAVVRLSMGTATGKTLTDAIFSAEESLGKIVEFTVLVDERVMPSRIGFLVEVEGAVGPDAHTVVQQLRDYLSLSSEILQRNFDGGGMNSPSVRIVKPGTFRDFRQWKVEMTGSGVGQTKVPTVLLDDAAKEWALERVVQEL
ncbi:hypothetical protein BV22DRAFT_1134237 [Leucogyrophana mollusca]|uniref:Uncharacterized protein n=1 Tax=Leucogyrophana mollusca TaxID=85980 RepID=A0ACB8AZE7_9AGAM|nr:hypothetical protein BV22DRAFT_1134237 [Leucogyrophana mollusca]